MGSLTWSLVVATLNREDCLVRSLRANTAQSRPPKQVIVVDSSADWEKVRARVLTELAPRTPGIEWVYLPSDQRSLTRQRNLGFVHCTSDIAFFLDDDSFMYPDCAEEIMGVYEADVNAELGGVCAGLAAEPRRLRARDGTGTGRPIAKPPPTAPGRARCPGSIWIAT